MKGRKIQVRIHTPTATYRFTRRVQKDGKTIIMRKRNDKKKRSEWKIQIDKDAMYEERGFMGLSYRKCIDIFYDAPKPITFDSKLEKTTQPKWDKETSTEFIHAESIRQMGRGSELKLPPVFWILVILVAMSLVLQFYQIAQLLGF